MKTRIIALSVLVIATIFVIAQSLPISRFPNTPTPLDSDLFVLAQTQAPTTNKNIRYDQLRGAIRSGLATETYVNNATNDLANGFVLNLVTNTSNFLSGNTIPRGSNMFSLQYTPQQGSTYYTGTNGIPTTNEARSGLEFSPFWRSLRMGEVAAGIDIDGWVGNGSNYWNNTNLGPLSVGFGSNAFVKGAFSSVLGGAYNSIQSNANYSVIGGGYNNKISSNASSSVISGGGRNFIRTDTAGVTFPANATIAGGSNNIIQGTSIAWCTIGGGGDNASTSAAESTISGGFGNTIREDGRFGFIGGGNNNRIGDVGGVTQASESSVIGGGSQNIIRGDYGFIGGGFQNNFRATGSDYNTISGGQQNDIGIATTSFSTHCFIGGGIDNNIDNACHYSVLSGGRNNHISGNSTNSNIIGGYNNLIEANVPFGNILGGRDNYITGTGDYGTIIGFSNQVSAQGAIAIGRTVTNATANAVMVSELVSYNTPAVIAGAGSGSTNYLLSVTSPKMLLGSSNVHIYGVSGTIVGKTHNWSVNITNLSADTWGINFASGTNRWKFQSWMYGTNAPSVLTNNTLLRLNGESEGTNTLVTYEYFSPAL